MVLKSLTLVMLICVTVAVHAGQTVVRDYRQHEGYLEKVEGERRQVSKELVLIQPPPPSGPTLQDRIFTDRLTREFREKAEERFGRTEAQRIYYSPGVFMNAEGVSAARTNEEIQMNEKERLFGEYMARRLVEYHVDNYAKNEPKARPVYEMKEKISSVNLEVVPGVKVDAKYSIASNSLDVNFVNPWLQSQVTLQLGASREATLSLKKGVTSTISLRSDYRVIDGTLAIIGSKVLNPRLSTSLTGSTFVNETGNSRRESLLLGGLSYSY